MLLALATDLVSICIYIVIALAVLSVVWIVVTKVYGMPIPQWLIQICAIVLGAVVAIMAIRFLVSL